MAGWSTHGGIHEVPLPDGVPGRMWLCGKHFIGPDVDAVLQRTGATTVVCLTQRGELEDRYPHYVAWLDANPSPLGDVISPPAESARALWFPVHDLSAPHLDEAAALMDDIAARLRAGEGVVIHCAAGIGRAGTTAIGVLMDLGMPLDEARHHVRAHRPMAGPEAGAQLELLQALDARHHPSA